MARALSKSEKAISTNGFLVARLVNMSGVVASGSTSMYEMRYRIRQLPEAFIRRDFLNFLPEYSVERFNTYARRIFCYSPGDVSQDIASVVENCDGRPASLYIHRIGNPQGLILPNYNSLRSKDTVPAGALFETNLRVHQAKKDVKVSTLNRLGDWSEYAPPLSERATETLMKKGLLALQLDEHFEFPRIY